MSKKEQIISFIEDFISNYVEDEIILSVADIRKWPCVAELCENHDSANICNAMKSVKYGKYYVGGVVDSTSFKMYFTKRFQNVKTEDFVSKDEMDKSVILTGWKYVVRKKSYAHIHISNCGQLWKHSEIKLDNAIINIYPTQEIAVKNAELTKKEIRLCPFCIKNK